MTLYDLKRSQEPPHQERYVYTRDTDQWLYNKAAPFPGALLAPLRLPGLTGFWGATYGTEIDEWSDLSGTLTRQLGFVTQADADISTVWPGAIAPYVYSTGAALSNGVGNRACPVTGVLTIGSWVRLPALTWTGGTTTVRVCEQYTSYRLRYIEGSTVFRFQITNTGTWSGLTVNSTTPTANTWHFVQARYTPSTSIEIRLDNGDWVTNTTSIPASLWLRDAAATDVFYSVMNIGAGEGVDVNMRHSQLWVCAYAVPDAVLNWLYAIQAPLFGKV